jgi:hypothetical protein
VKYVAFAAFTLTAVPAMTMAAYGSRASRGRLLALLVFATALGDLANINFLSLESYRGPDRGFEINLADLIAFALAAALILRHGSRLRWLPFNTLPILAFGSLALLSTLISSAPLYGTFTLFKLAKFYLIYWCVVNALSTGTPRRYVWWGLVMVAALLTSLAFYQKYMLDVYRVYASFDHSNTVPTYANLAIPLLVAWGLVDRSLGRWGTLIGGVAALGLTFTVVATFSRAGIVLAGSSIVGALLLSSRLAPLGRQAAAWAGLLVGLLAGGVLAGDSLAKRFKEAPASSLEARREFNMAADQMARDHWLGIGLNNFSHVLTRTPAYREHITVMENEEASGVAHHIYKLTAAEVGYVGLALFLWLMGRFTLLVGWGGLRVRSVDGALIYGVFLGICTLHASGLLEWTFRTTPVLYLFGVLIGVGVALARARTIPRSLRPPVHLTPQAEAS